MPLPLQAVEATHEQEPQPTPVESPAESPSDAETLDDDAAVQQQVDDFFAPGPDDDLDDFLESLEPDALDDEVLVEGIAAQVGGEVVLVSEVRRLAAPIEARMRKAGAPEAEIRSMRADALERLIESRLIAEVVRRAQLDATDEEVNQAIQSIANENGLTLQQMQQSIAGHGLTTAEYRAKIKSEIERSKVLGSVVRSRVHVEDAELETLYQERFGKQRSSGTEIHLRHILIGFGAALMRDDATACRMADEVREAIAEGDMSFAEAAQQLSDANSRQRGGDLGWVHLDELASWMAPAVEGLQPGEMSGVIAMPFGCNLLELVERREFEPVTFEDARPQIEQFLFRQKMDAEYASWIDKLREQVYIERKGLYAETTRLGADGGSRSALGP